MNGAVEKYRHVAKRTRQPVELVDRLEHTTALDRPVRKIADLVRHGLRTGKLRDTLHGVFFGQPVHPPLAVVSIGCWMSAALLDLTRGNERASRALIATGLANALPTVATGVTDWSVLHREQQRVGLVHAMTNLTAFGLYTGCLAARMAGLPRAGKALGYAGLALASAGGYLGGRLSFRQGAGSTHAESITHLIRLGWHDLCALDDLPEGRPVCRRLGYISLFVLRRSDEVYVLADRCAHLAGPLHQGRLVASEGELCVVCPWHGSTYRLADGSVVHGPATAPQPSFDTRVTADGTLQIRPAR